MALLNNFYRTGAKKRAFHSENPPDTWPVFKWAHDDKFFARMTQVRQGVTFLKLYPVFRIRISSYADPGPGSQKWPYGYRSNTNKFSTKFFKFTFNKSLKNNKQNINLTSIAKGSLLLFFHICIHPMNLYIV